MEILTDFVCFEQASFDIAYMTEVDPLWQDDSLAALINPEAIIFANPLAKAACAGDCIAGTVNLPLDQLFWCAGCQGGMYPLNGNIPASIGHVQSSRLALSRFAYKMHRQALAWGTMGSAGLCKKYLRSEEHTSELQSLMRISYSVFCFQTKTTSTYTSCSYRDLKSHEINKP